MPQTIDVPGQGLIEFPDGMNDDDISSAIRKITQKPIDSLAVSNRQIPTSSEELGAQNFAGNQAAEDSLFKQSGMTRAQWSDLKNLQEKRKFEESLNPDTAETTLGAAGVAAIRKLAHPDESILKVNPQDLQTVAGLSPETSKTLAASLSIDPETAPNAAEVRRVTGLPPVASSIASSVGRGAQGLAQFVTSPSGISQAAAAATPAGILVRAKWLYDMVGATGTGAGNITALLEKYHADPNSFTEEDLQHLNDETVNTASMLFMAGKMGEHEYTKATGLPAPIVGDKNTRLSTALAGALKDEVSKSKLESPDQFVLNQPVNPPDRPEGYFAPNLNRSRKVAEPAASTVEETPIRTTLGEIDTEPKNKVESVKTDLPLKYLDGFIGRWQGQIGTLRFDESGRPVLEMPKLEGAPQLIELPGNSEMSASEIGFEPTKDIIKTKKPKVVAESENRLLGDKPIIEQSKVDPAELKSNLDLLQSVIGDVGKQIRASGFQPDPTALQMISAVTDTIGKKGADVNQLYGALQATPIVKRQLTGIIQQLEKEGRNDEAEPFYASLDKIEKFENDYQSAVTKPDKVVKKAKTSGIVPQPELPVAPPVDVSKLGKGIDFADIKKPHQVGIETALNLGLSEKDVPALETRLKSLTEKMVQAAETGEDFQSVFGEQTYISGIIEGAKKKGANYDYYMAEKAKAAKPAAPAAPAVEANPVEPVVAPEVKPLKTRLDLMLDGVEKSGKEVTIQVTDANRENLSKIIELAEARGLRASTDGGFVLIRPKEVNPTPPVVEKPIAPKVATKPADKPFVEELKTTEAPKENNPNHIAIVNGKETPIVVTRNEGESAKNFSNRQFRFTSQVVAAQLKRGEVGYVRTPDGKLFELRSDSKTAKPVTKMQGNTPIDFARRNVEALQKQVDDPKASANEKKVVGQRLEEAKKALAELLGKSEQLPTVEKPVSPYKVDQTIEVQLSKNKNAKWVKARIISINSDGSVQVSVKGKKPIFTTVEHAQTAPAKRTVTAQLKKAQFEGMTPDEAAKIKSDSKEFDDLLRSKPEHGFYRPEAETSGTEKESGFAKNTELKNARRLAFKELGADDKIDSDSDIEKAKMLPALKKLMAEKDAEFHNGELAEQDSSIELTGNESTDFLSAEDLMDEKPAAPKLGQGQKQGDLLSSTQKEDLSLAGERGIDADRIAADKAKAEADKKASDEFAAKNQMELGGGELPVADFPQDLAKTLLSLPAERRSYPMGDENKKLRQQVLKAITGKDVPIAKAGSGAVRQALAEHFGIDTTKISMAGVEDAIESQLRLIADGKKPKPNDHKDLGADTHRTEKRSGGGFSIKNAWMDAQREKLGLDPAMPVLRETWGSALDKAEAIIDKDPSAPEKLIAELKKTPRSLDPTEKAMVAWKWIQDKTEFDNLSREIMRAHEDGRLDDVKEMQIQREVFGDALNDLATISKLTGTIEGRALNARKMFIDDDFTLSSLEIQKRGSNGGKSLEEIDAEKGLPEGTTRSEIEKVAADYKKANDELQRHLKDAKTKISEMEVKAALDRIEAEKRNNISPYVISVAEKIVGTLDTAADAARKRIQERKKRLNAGIDPTMLADYAIIGASHIGHIGLDFVKWTAAMKAEGIEESDADMKQIFESSKKMVDKVADNLTQGKTPEVKATVKKTVKEKTARTVQGDIDKVRKKISEKVNDEKPEDVTFQVQKLARLLIEEGVNDREELIDRIHSYLKEEMPDITRDEAMDAISGYGKFRQLSKDAVSVRLRGFKGEMQQLAKLREMAEGIPPRKTGMERRTPTEAERKLIKAVNEAKIKFQVPITDPATQLKSALDTRKTQLQNKIKDLQEKLKNKDFSTRPKRELVLDRRAMELTAIKERVAKKWKEGQMRDKLANRTKMEKTMDAIANIRRMAVLSGVKVLAKLFAYSATKMPSFYATEGVGRGLARLPGVSEIARRAPSESGATVSQTSKALAKALTKGFDDAYKTWKTGQSDLKAAFNARPQEARQWHHLFQILHEILKSPLRRGAFELSMAKRMEHYALNANPGDLHVNDPIVQFALGKDAYLDSDRALLLESNRLSSAIRSMFKQIEQPNKKTKKVELGNKALATFGRVELPILSVPLNYAKQTLTHAFGLVSGGLKARAAFKSGIDKLTLEEADQIMRHLKVGSIGGALLLYGFYDGFHNGNNGTFGGFYQSGQKRKEGETDFGAMNVGGHHIGAWSLHNPLIAVGQLGHTMGAITASLIKKQKDGSGVLDKAAAGLAGILAGAWGLVSESPLGRESKFVTELGDPHAFNYAAGEHAKGLIAPQLVQEIAKVTDLDKDGHIIERKPTTIPEHIKSGFPILREEVPINKPKGAKPANKVDSEDKLRKALFK